MGSDWRKASFAQLCDIKRGASPRPIQDWVASTGIPWVKISDANASRGRFITETRECIKVAGRSKSVTVYPGDLILSNSATPGIPKFLGIEACIHDGWLLLRNFRGLDKQFAYYLLLTQREALIGQGNGSVFTNLKTEILKNHEVTIPPLGEQHRIAEFLGWIDERLELIHSTNTTLEAIAQALFKSWFVDFDPVHAKAEGREPEAMDAATAALFPSTFEDSETGLIPKSWRISTLGAFCDTRGGTIQTGPFGSQLHASDYVTGDGVPVVMPQDLAGRRIVEDQIARTSTADAERLSRHKLRRGDIVFGRRGDVGRHGIVTARQQGWLCGTGCLLVRPSHDAPPVAFVSCALARHESLDWLERHAVGATMPNLNTKILIALPMIAPPDKVVAAYEQIAGVLERRMSGNLEQAATLASLRDTLVPRLISGKLRLPEATEAAEAALA